MVKEVKNNGKECYECEECKLLFEDKILAEKCEAWCKKNNSCNLEITKYKINMEETKMGCCGGKKKPKPKRK